MSEWQTIDTAPKDGTKILIYSAGTDGGPVGVFAAWWDAQFKYRYTEKRGEWHEGAWTDYAVKSFGYEQFQSYCPTHWQPLPKPPAQS